MALLIQQQPALPRLPRPITIIGAGGIVKDAHLPAYRKAGFEVQAIYDRDRGRAESLAKAFGVPRVGTTLRETVAGATRDALFDVAVPASAILSVLGELPDGAGVLIQKPMGETLEHAHQILELCRSKRLTAAINFQLRYAPYILAARSLIEQGAIGEVHDMEVRVTVYMPWQLWKFLEGIPRVEILYHSIHYLDLVRSFLGDPHGVYAKTVKHPQTTNLASSRSSLILDYGDMLRANIQTNHGHDFGLKHQESYVKWEGSKGAIKARLGLLMSYPKGEPDAFEYCAVENDEVGAWKAVPLEGSWYPDAFIGTMASLMRRVNGETDELPTSVEDALHTMALVEACYQSNAHGATPIPGSG
jgi:predicted dehydrogenase